MKLTVLEPVTPKVRATKKIHLDPGTNAISIDAYPNISEWNSYEAEVTSIEELASTLKDISSKGWCIQKGQLTKPLRGQRRAKQTLTHEPTEYLLLDVDAAQGFTSAEEWVQACLPAQFQNVSYVMTYSPGYGFKDQWLRAHFFFFLSKPCDVGLLKEWTKFLNLRNARLIENLELNKNGMSLRWAVDITTNQNDKLIYVAAPTMDEGITDPITERVVAVKKDRDAVDLDLTKIEINVIDAMEMEKINQLRKDKGLQKKAAKWSKDGSLLLNPDRCTIMRPVKDDGDIIRVNLAGDNPSWGYYFFKNNPAILHNFKGAPAAFLKDIDPGFWAELLQHPEYQGVLQSDTVLAFRDPITDTYYNAVWDPIKQEFPLMAVAGSKDKLNDFLIQRGMKELVVVPDYRLIFDMHAPPGPNKREKTINQYVETNIWKAAKTQGKVTTLPPTIELVFRSMTGDDVEAYEYFLNWLAYVFQKRTRTQTAWILHGTEGTGKGVAFNHIIRPVLGPQVCQIKTISELSAQFNGWMESTLLCLVDESELSNRANNHAVIDLIKNRITEPTIDIRKMRTNPYQVHSNLNFIFTSNRYEPAAISMADRRFNVAPRQETPLKLTSKQIYEVIPTELAQFASFVYHYQVDETKAKTALKNKAKHDLALQSETTIETFFRKVREGELDWFIDILVNSPYESNNASYVSYSSVIRSWAGRLLDEGTSVPGTNLLNGTIKLTNAELQKAFTFAQAGEQPTATKFGKMMAINKVPSDRFYMDDKQYRGAVVKMTGSADLINQILDNNTAKLRAVK